MNRKQSIVLFFVLIALVVTWLFPYYIFDPLVPRDSGPHITYGDESAFVHPHYSFLFSQGPPEAELKIDWGRLLLTDLIIAAVGAPILYAVRSKS